MNIELRGVDVSDALSRQSLAYSAEVWIDGEPAFHVRNHGQGSADVIEPLGAWTEAAVTARLRTRREPSSEGHPTHDLRAEIAQLLRRHVICGLERLMTNHLVTIEGGQIFQYPLRERSVSAIRSIVLGLNPDALVLNDADETVLAQAVAMLTARAR